MKRRIEFGLWFAKEREKSGYESQRQLAEVVGVSNATIARIESGFVPKPDTLKRLSEKMKSTDYAEMMAQAGYLSSEDASSQPSNAPDWATAKDKRDFKKMLEKDGEAMFYGDIPLDDEDREKIKRVIEALFWDAKKQNKRKKPDQE